MPIKLYNSLTKQIETFVPIVKNKVNFYVCGVTVYDYCHLGHGRIFVVFDLLYRLFKFLGFEVNYVRNVTDIDDKIIQKANALKVPYTVIAEQFYTSMLADEKALNVIPPTLVPKASEHINEMITFINALINQGYAYVNEGDVYYRVKNYKSYGTLAHQTLDHLLTGVRISPLEKKEYPLDFVLWKKSKPNEPAWQSPWGLGRPGWHIECSAMANQYLGHHFDLHGGGMDLLFPHHQNELAQTEALTHEPLANYWMHVGFVQYKQEKMSKSLGNFFTLRDLLKDFSGETLRYFYLTSHYQNPINFSHENILMAENSLRNLYLALKDFEGTSTSTSISEQMRQHRFYQQFFTALKDNLNTPLCLSILFELVHVIHQARLAKQVKSLNFYQTLLYFLGQQLGLLNMPTKAFLKSGIDNQQVEALIQQRLKAKQNKDWQAADQIRNQLKQQGVILEDVASNQTEWYLLRTGNGQ